MKDETKGLSRRALSCGPRTPDVCFSMTLTMTQLRNISLELSSKLFPVFILLLRMKGIAVCLPATLYVRRMPQFSPSTSWLKLPCSGREVSVLTLSMRGTSPCLANRRLWQMLLMMLHHEKAPRRYVIYDVEQTSINLALPGSCGF